MTLEFKTNFRTWDEVFKYLIEKSYKRNEPNTDVAIPAKKLTSPKQSEKFNSAHRKSFKLGSDYVFRDTRTRESLQVRVYQDGKPHERFGKLTQEYDGPLYVVQLNQFNPKKGIIESLAHLYEDVLKLPNPFAEYNQ